MLISPFLLLSSTPGHAQCQWDRLSFTMGLSFTDVPWIKYEGCWESGHLEKERKTRKVVWVGAPWEHKVRLEKASLTGMEARTEDLNGQSLCPWLVHALTSSTLSLPHLRTSSGLPGAIPQPWSTCRPWSQANPGSHSISLAP